MLKKRCSNQGITLLNAYDYYRVRQGENRAVTLYFLVKSPGILFNRTYPPNQQFQQSITAYSSLSKQQNIIPTTKDFSFEKLKADRVGVGIWLNGYKAVGGGATPHLFPGGIDNRFSDSGLPIKRVYSGRKLIQGPYLNQDEFLLVISPDLNLVQYGNQILTIEIPNSKYNNKTTFNLNLKKGANSTWSEITCL